MSVMAMENSAEFDAIVRLLDDGDPIVTTSVLQKLESYGADITPVLHSLLESVSHPHARATLEEAIRFYRLCPLRELLDSVRSCQENETDILLEHSIMLLSKFGYPEMLEDEVSEWLDDKALRVHSHFMKVTAHDDLNLLMCLNRVFYDEEHFRGADEDYYNADNSYLLPVIRRKTGIPIAISLLFMFIAERAGIEIHGIAMPLHFVVYHPELDVYIDLYNQGIFLAHADCKRFITNSGFAFQPEMLEQASNLTILVRMIRNLIHAHQEHHETWEAAQLQSALDEILEHEH